MPRIIAALLSCVLCSCCPAAYSPPPRWPPSVRYVVVYVSTALPDVQINALRMAVADINAHSARALLILHEVDEHDLSVNGQPPFGSVGVSNAPPQSPFVAADATVYRTRAPQYIHSVDVRLTGRCDLHCAKHELLHAAGLVWHSRSGIMSGDGTYALSGRDGWEVGQ